MTRPTNTTIHSLTYTVANVTVTKDWESRAVILAQDGARIAVPINQVRHLIDALVRSASEIAGATVGDEVGFV